MERVPTGYATIHQSDYHQRRIDHCSRRYLAAIKTLAQVRRLQVPPVQVNIGERHVNLAGVLPTTLARRGAKDRA